MENPATWGEAEHIIHDAIKRHENGLAEDRATGQFHAGLSLVMQIADALRAEDLLVDRPAYHGKTLEDVSLPDD